MKKKIIHQINLVGIGGVQSSFLHYIDFAFKRSKFCHEVFSNFLMDRTYRKLAVKFYNIKKISALMKFIFRLISKKYIIHFYNNLGSKRLWIVLSLLPVNNIIMHERGSSWNVSSTKKKIVLKNSRKAKLIIANSQASKELLIQKFGLDGGKIKVIYNGFLGDHIKYSKQVKNKQFTVGFIGRLDSPKGVEVLIKAAKKLIKYKFKIAGNGPLKNFLISESNSFDNIEFVGRVNNPYNFINNIDLLVVPSVREPLGNVIIEAGFLKKPVIASCVDGIPELITDNESGILLMPKCELDKNFDGTLKHPEYVINGITKKLDQPKNIDYLELSNTIEELADDRKKREFLSNNLNKKVLKNCKLVNYFNQLENVYNTF